MAGLREAPAGPLAEQNLVVPLSEAAHGNFLTFDHPEAADWSRRLHEAGIVTDVRGTRLRVGFGLQHAADDIDALLARLRTLKA